LCGADARLDGPVDVALPGGGDVGRREEDAAFGDEKRRVGPQAGLLIARELLPQVADGTIKVELVVSGFGPGGTKERFREIVSTALEYGRQITAMSGRMAPADYAPRLP
jgi:hypothetical protein